MNCRVVVEAAVPVYDVETADEAVRIAISKTGEMLNPDLNYVEINMGERSCPHCGEGLDPAFIAADESLVALELEMTVFNVEREEHASRIARKEIGQLLESIPLEVLEIEVLEEEGDDDDGDVTEDEDADSPPETDEANENEASDEKESPVEDGSQTETAEETSESSSTADLQETAESETTGDTGSSSDSEGTESRDAAILPEFEELIDE